MSLPVRRPVSPRRARTAARRRRVRGSWPRPNGWRVLGAALMALSGGALLWLLSSAQFEVDAGEVSISDLRYTDAGLVQASMSPWLASRPNVFRIPAARLEQELTGLPAVARARVDVLLPDRLVVAIVERVPVFVWRNDERDFLVDSSGVLLREILADEPLPSDLPLVEDGRRRAEAARPGDRLEAVDLQAVLKLGAVDAQLLDSSAEWLSLAVEEDDGYVLRAEPTGWRAVFGHYTPTLRPPDIIERQVQCLRALLADDEAAVEAVYLSPANERCGTYVGRASPEPGGQRGRGGDDDE